jgi:hypothetical protein
MARRATRAPTVLSALAGASAISLRDNRSTMHRRDPFDNATRRVMHRTQIKGKSAPRAWAEAA